MENLINNISHKTIQNFFRKKSEQFKPREENYSHYLKEDDIEFVDELFLLGEIGFGFEIQYIN